MPVSTCGKCNKIGQGFPKCSACKSISYCSRECQKLDWKWHKIVCKEARKRKNAKKSALFKQMEKHAKRKRWSQVKSLMVTALAKQDSSNIHMFQGSPVASQAAQLGDVRILQMLLDNGVDMKELDNAERTIFIYAAIGGNVESSI